MTKSRVRSGRKRRGSEGVVSKHSTFQACVSISCQFRHAFELARALVPTPARIIAELGERDRALELRNTPARACGPGLSKSAARTGPRYSTQRAGIAPPHAEGDGLSGVTSDRESNAFISIPAGVAGGVPLTRARNPWAMPEAST